MKYYTSSYPLEEKWLEEEILPTDTPFNSVMPHIPDTPITESSLTLLVKLFRKGSPAHHPAVLDNDVLRDRLSKFIYAWIKLRVINFVQLDRVYMLLVYYYKYDKNWHKNADAEFDIKLLLKILERITHAEEWIARCNVKEAFRLDYDSWCDFEWRLWDEKHRLTVEAMGSENYEKRKAKNLGKMKGKK